MKILTILGARPQFIKAASVSREIARHKTIKETILHTGQHYDANMSEIFFEEMKIPKPDYFLGIGGKTHGAMTGQMMEKIEKIIFIECPDAVVVYGDTNSTLAGALVASKLGIRLAHVEAGLRSFNMKMPEEINRILTDRVSNLLFCPTEAAVQNLKNEGFEKFNCSIIKSGDVMQDGALFYEKLAKKPMYDIPNKFILSTVHRAENTDDVRKLKNIIKALSTIDKQIKVILPLHPRTKKIIEQNNIFIDFIVTEPLGYLEMIWLISNCDMVMTDSGGLQKEAFYFKKPCITLRDETEWVELVQNDFNVLAGTKKDKIIECFYKKDFNRNFGINLYGNGTASKQIVCSMMKKIK